MQVKDYHRKSSPAAGVDGMYRDSLGCLKEDFVAEAVEQQEKQDAIRQTPSEQKQTQFVVPRSRRRTDRVMTDETNLPQACLPCKRNLLEHAHCLRSRFPCQVRYSYIIVIA